MLGVQREVDAPNFIGGLRVVDLYVRETAVLEVLEDEIAPILVRRVLERDFKGPALEREALEAHTELRSQLV